MENTSCKKENKKSCLKNVKYANSLYCLQLLTGDIKNGRNEFFKYK